MKKILVALFILLPTFAFAFEDTFRCGGDIINTGDSSYRILDKCGEPDSKRNVGTTSEAEGLAKLVIEEWVYKKNGRRYILRIVGSKLESVRDEKLD